MDLTYFMNGLKQLYLGDFKMARILGFVKHWDKLDRYEFTTFRVPRKDKDWGLNELVQIVVKPRSKEREFLGTANIVQKDIRNISDITDKEAKLDGFKNAEEMGYWLEGAHPHHNFMLPFHKLTLVWVDKVFK